MQRRTRSAARAGVSIDLRSIKLAIAAAECGSFRLAAKRERMGTPAVSRRIQALEDALGVSLFERRPSGARLTEAGEQFLADASRLLREVRAAEERAREAGSGAIGKLVIGTYFSASKGRFRDALLRFVGRHRRVELLVIEGDREQLLSDVRRGRTDVAILLGPHDEPGLERLGLWQEAGMIALPVTHRLVEAPLLGWWDLAGETFIVTPRGSGPETRAKVEALLPREHSASFAVHDVGREAMFNLVGAGLGIAVLAESASGVSYPGVVFRPVGDKTGRTMVEAAAYWDPERDNPASRRFLSLLRATQASRDGG